MSGMSESGATPKKKHYKEVFSEKSARYSKYYTKSL